MKHVYSTQLTPLSFLRRAADVWPDKDAIVYADRRLTYRAFAESAEATARALRSAGVAPGDRVAYLMPNVPEALIAQFAVPLAGAVLLAINTRLAAPEVGYVLDHSGASVLVVDAELLATAHRSLSEAPAIHTVVVVGSGSVDLPESSDHRTFVTHEDFLASADDSAVHWSVEDEYAPLALNYTSGTTGRPKGVVYTHRGAYLNALGEIIHSGHTADSVYLWTLPMFHCNGWCTGWAVTAIGGTHVCLREVRPDVIWDLIGTEGISHINGAPTVMTTIINASEAKPLERPITVTTAGAPPAPATIEQMEALGFSIVHVYGLTETYGPYSVCQPQDSWARLDNDQLAVRKARQGVGMIQAERLRVVDANMQDVVSDGETMGEVVMRGNNVMAGYFRDPDGTAAAFAGGWFHSGDLGVMHPDGYVELRDRAKDVVISGGENISTIEVEQALMAHAAVSEAAVVGVPDEKWGERPKAFVILRRGAQTSEHELIEHVRSRIARYKAPRDIEFVVELPKTSTGKIQKFALRDAAWSGQANKIQG
ncbi:long-chain-fatty-acid--CoA ligase [Nocardia sp. NBC_00565]|uniref:long-chain-fatty-acid--CoA ligase n=1 Tax=Nocardia sp. NBC_00565 TaxID=2975993 RepID=UPI002E81C404|nr:long-chain-fatty-acid--CoA ligase [Nocardia sp. NBC_00565]WUC06341.1 long-chain-fatty-acid--CoA ligase [Nocardia sp. NBC_00565]